MTSEALGDSKWLARRRAPNHATAPSLLRVPICSVCLALSNAFIKFEILSVDTHISQVVTSDLESEKLINIIRPKVLRAKGRS